MTTAPADYFSPKAAGYAAFRPTYPPALFDFVAALAPRRACAWDCATGSGQAAVALAGHFARVVATDASPAQLAHAAPHPRVTYRAAPAEASGLPNASADLVVVAQALHWFDRDAFYAEARRVLVPGGAVVVWSYGDAVLGAAGPADAALDAAFQHYAGEVLAPYWPPERRLVGEAYREIPFPFTEVAAPAFPMTRACTLAELVGYVGTWSATTQYVRATGRDPITGLERALAPHWRDPERRVVVRWPLTVRAGHVAQDPPSPLSA
ncbi:SAM-dependent methyltransferase [Gemmatimonadetes bacterium T265]|nr:SAM-dependent methyltransferase [Gemmatimonadetes bacterium T265]